MTAYMNSRSLPPRVEDEELCKLVALAKTCPVAMRKVLDACSNSVYVISSKLYYYCVMGIDQSDLVQEGFLAISEKVKRSDMSNVPRINAYLYGVARNSIKTYVFKNSTTLYINDSSGHDTRRAFWKLRSTIVRLGSFKLACEELKISEDVGHHVLMALGGSSQILEYEVDDDAPRLVASDFDLEEIVNEEMVARTMKAAVKKLDARRRDIIEKRYFRDEPMKYQDIAKLYGVSHQRIQQLENDAIRMMQTA